MDSLVDTLITFWQYYHIIAFLLSGWLAVGISNIHAEPQPTSFQQQVIGWVYIARLLTLAELVIANNYLARYRDYLFRAFVVVLVLCPLEVFIWCLGLWAGSWLLTKLLTPVWWLAYWCTSAALNLLSLVRLIKPDRWQWN